MQPPSISLNRAANERTPQLVSDAATQMFFLFYLLGNDVNDSATVMMRQAAFATPWSWSAAMMVNDTNLAVMGAGLSAAVGPDGVAVAWTSRFVLGDDDIRFDASWRGTVARPRYSVLPTRSVLGVAYPNPFNGATVITVSLDHPRAVELQLSDILGRRVMSLDAGELSSGVHRIALDCARLGSGTYFASIPGAVAPPIKLILIR